MNDIEYLIALLAAATVLVRLADIVSVPYPIVLVVAGLALGFAPGLPDVRLAPEVVFLVFLPPLLHAEAWGSSARELRVELGPLAMLSVVLVLATVAGVAVVAHAVVGDLSWAEAFTLGAIVGPTDPVSAAATFGRIGVPYRVGLVVRGESLVNDAVALVLYRAGAAAIVSGSFSIGHTALNVLATAAGGAAVGAVFGWLVVALVARVRDTAVSIVMTVVVAYASYVLAEKLGLSGVLAVVATGVWFGWRSHAMDPEVRLSAVAFWQVLVLVLNALLFLLLGLQFSHIVDGVQRFGGVGSLVGATALVCLAVAVIRLVLQFVPVALARVVPAAARLDPADSWRERVIVGWSGMRGAISLAAALSLPLAVGARDRMIFVTFGVILATLLVQGLTLPLVVRGLGVQGEREWTPDEAIARLEAAQSALDRVDELEESGGAPEEVLARLRELYQARFQRCVAVLGGEGAAPPRRGYGDLRRELIGRERAALLGLRDSGKLRQDVLRRIERDLDLEEARLASR
jgi:Na+/H+ antiporter